MALPRLPLGASILSLSSSKLIPRFFETCRAAMHCPRFLNGEQVLWRSLTVIPLLARAFVSAVFKFLLSLSRVVGDFAPTALLECPLALAEGPVPLGPTSEGRPTLLGAPTPDGRPIPPAGR